MSGASVQSVERSFVILESLADADGPLGVSDLALRTGLPYATIHRLLATLAAGGYVRQEPSTRKYLLGSGVLRLATAATRALGAWAQPHLDELAAASGETANLAVLEADYVAYIAQAQSRRVVRMFTEVGNRVPPHSTAVGKVLLAHRPHEEVAALIARRGLPARTPRTITDPQALLAELRQVARQGYAVDDEEAELGVRCLAIGIPSAGICSAAVSISGPAGRLTVAEQEAVLPQMRRIAAGMAAAGPRS